MKTDFINFELLEVLIIDDDDKDDDDDDDDYDDNDEYDVFSSSIRIWHTICTRGGRGVILFNYDDDNDDDGHDDDDADDDDYDDDDDMFLKNCKIIIVELH